MPTDELEQALKRLRTGVKPTGQFELVAELLGIDVGTVARVAWALSLPNADSIHRRGPLLEEYRKHLEVELQDAIDLNYRIARERNSLARAAQDEDEVMLPVHQLIDQSEKEKICIGCEERVECLADSLFKPSDCYYGRYGQVPVTVEHVTKTSVRLRAHQPAGVYTIRLKKLI